MHPKAQTHIDKVIHLRFKWVLHSDKNRKLHPHWNRKVYFFSFFREHIVIQRHTKCHLVPSECFTWTTYKYHSSNPWRQCGCNYSPPRHGDVMPFARLGPDDDLVDLPRLTKLFANILFSAWEASAFEDNLFRFFMQGELFSNCLGLENLIYQSVECSFCGRTLV